MFRAAAEALNYALKSTVGVLIVYRREGKEAFVMAYTGKKLYSYVDNDGFLVHEQTRDFIILADDLQSAGISLPPAIGDEIEYDNRLYAVSAVNDEPAWNWSDRGHVMLRVHTRLIGDE